MVSQKDEEYYQKLYIGSAIAGSVTTIGAVGYVAYQHSDWVTRTFEAMQERRIQRLENYLANIESRGTIKAFVFLTGGLALGTIVGYIWAKLT